MTEEPTENKPIVTAELLYWTAKQCEMQRDEARLVAKELLEACEAALGDSHCMTESTKAFIQEAIDKARGMKL